MCCYCNDIAEKDKRKMSVRVCSRACVRDVCVCMGGGVNAGFSGTIRTN